MRDAAARYSDLWLEREPFVRRAEICAQYTLPMIFPKAGFNSTNVLELPYNGLGARAVHTLVAKILLAVFPPGSPFFKFVVDPGQTINMTDADAKEKNKIEDTIADFERVIVDDIETRADRVTKSEALYQLLIAGNVLFMVNDKGPSRIFKLNQYVVKRDYFGTPQEIIIKEEVSPSELPPQAYALWQEEHPVDMSSTDVGRTWKYSDNTKVDLYTHLYREGKKMKIYQQLKTKVIPGTEGSYALEACPYLPLRIRKQDGEDYSRSYTEEHLSDLVSLDNLSKAIQEGSLAAARVILMVNPNSMTSPRHIRDAKNGDVILGDVNQVGVLQMQKYGDFRVAKEEAAEISRRLEAAFLMNSSIQRQAERVTAEEIRFMAKDLEDNLGGLYTLLAAEWQAPYIKRIVASMQRTKRLPKWDSKLLKPTIITGVEALGRGNDMQKLSLFTQYATGVAALPPAVNSHALLERGAISLGLSAKDLVRSQEELAAEQQQMMQQQMQSQMAPELLRQGAGIMKQGMQTGELSIGQAANAVAAQQSGG